MAPYYLLNLETLLKGKSFEKARIFRKECAITFTSIKKAYVSSATSNPPNQQDHTLKSVCKPY